MKEDRLDIRLKGQFLLDMILVVLAFVLAYQIKRSPFFFNGGLSSDPNYYLVLICVVLSSAVAFDLLRVARGFAAADFRSTPLPVVKAVLASLVGLVFLLYLFKIEAVSRALLALYVVLLCVFMLLTRFIVISYRNYRHSRGRDSGIQVLIVGSRERAVELIHYLDQNRPNGYHLIGCVETCDEKKRVGCAVCDDVHVIATMDEFQRILSDQVVDEVIFAMPLKKIANIVEHISFAEQIGVNVRILPDWQLQKIMYRPEIGSVNMSSFVGIPTLVLSSLPRREFELVIKGLFDRVAAAVALVVLSPLFACFAVIIKATSAGPVFFMQRRCGLNGREFTLYKFRTMVANAEQLREQLLDENEMDGPVFKITDDPRVTRIGSLLRKTSLDELPQLINIVKGEMSFVGPRPPLPDEVKEYAVWQRRRLSMKPGLTCIWQVSGRNDISFEQWMNMDLEYIDKWSFISDIKLILRTVPAVVLGTGR